MSAFVGTGGTNDNGFRRRHSVVTCIGLVLNMREITPPSVRICWLFLPAVRYAVGGAYTPAKSVATLRKAAGSTPLTSN